MPNVSTGVVLELRGFSFQKVLHQTLTFLNKELSSEEEERSTSGRWRKRMKMEKISFGLEAMYAPALKAKF